MKEVIDKLGYFTHSGSNNNTVKDRIEKYQIDIKESVEEFDCIEYVTLFLKKYNIKNEDYDRVYEMILNDFKNARIGKISLDRI